MWDGMMGGVGWLWMLLWGLFSIALLGLVVLALVWLARSVGSGSGQSSPGREPSAGGTAREALDLRYARGEISREEYLQARRDLEGPLP
jgi:putative membrane protein